MKILGYKLFSYWSVLPHEFRVKVKSVWVLGTWFAHLPIMLCVIGRSNRVICSRCCLYYIDSFLKKPNTLCFYLMLLSSTIWAQANEGKVTVTGIVTEFNSGERIAGAAVYLPNQRAGIYTDVQGYFSLAYNTLVDSTIYVSYPGYMPDTVALKANEESIKVILRPMLSKVITVTDARTKLAPTGAVNYSIEELERLPQLLGEPDLLKSLTASPGIQEGTEGTVGINVRGGSDDQNLYLLDGSVIYNPSHVFGFISLFHPATVQSLSVYKGYIPATYSGRLSSVIDVGIRSGHQEKVKWKASIGPITNSVLVEGPLNHGKSNNRKTFIIAARLANTSLFTLASQALGTLDENGNRILAGMYDFTAKYTNRYANGGTLNLSTYLGDDLWGGRSNAGSLGVSGEEIIWGNKVLALRYHRPLLPALTYEGKINLNRYANTYRNFERNDGVTRSIRNDGSINEIQSTHSLSLKVERSELTLGLGLLLQSSKPIELSFRDGNTVQKSGDFTYLTTNLRGFIEEKYTVFPFFKVTAGVSLGNYSNSTDSYRITYVEPRLGVEGQISSNTAYGLSYTSTYQPVHRISSFAIGLPYDIWIPANKLLPIEKAKQYAGEFRYYKEKDVLVFGAYFKRMRNLVYPPNDGILPTSGTVDNSNAVDRIIGSGLGRSYGGEFTFEHSGSRGKSVLAYTYSRSFRAFEQLNRGLEFNFDFDRPHDLSISQQYIFSKKWEFNGRFVYQSGRTITLPTSMRINAFGQLSLEYPGVNNFRLKPYHRLDVAFTKNIVTKKKQRTAKLTLGVYNLYARGNPVRIFPREVSTFQSSTNGQIVGYELITSSVLLFIPSINYAIEW